MFLVLSSKSFSFAFSKYVFFYVFTMGVMFNKLLWNCNELFNYIDYSSTLMYFFISVQCIKFEDLHCLRCVLFSNSWNIHMVKDRWLQVLLLLMCQFILFVQRLCICGKRQRHQNSEMSCVSMWHASKSHRHKLTRDLLKGKWMQSHPHKPAESLRA